LHNSFLRKCGKNIKILHLSKEITGISFAEADVWRRVIGEHIIKTHFRKEFEMTFDKDMILK